MGKHLEGRPWLTTMGDKGNTLGVCANCKSIVREYQSTLDDAYSVIRLVCPSCEAVNLLNPQKNVWRGYTSQEMFLTLPTDHEMKMNGWKDTNITRSCDCRECKKEETK